MNIGLEDGPPPSSFTSTPAAAVSTPPASAAAMADVADVAIDTAGQNSTCLDVHAYSWVNRYWALPDEIATAEELLLETAVVEPQRRRQMDLSNVRKKFRHKLIKMKAGGSCGENDVNDFESGEKHESAYLTEGEGESDGDHDVPAEGSFDKDQHEGGLGASSKYRLRPSKSKRLSSPAAAATMRARGDGGGRMVIENSSETAPEIFSKSSRRGRSSKSVVADGIGMTNGGVEGGRGGGGGGNGRERDSRNSEAIGSLSHRHASVFCDDDERGENSELLDGSAGGGSQAVNSFAGMFTVAGLEGFDAFNILSDDSEEEEEDGGSEGEPEYGDDNEDDDGEDDNDDDGDDDGDRADNRKVLTKSDERSSRQSRAGGDGEEEEEDYSDDDIDAEGDEEGHRPEATAAKTHTDEVHAFQSLSLESLGSLDDLNLGEILGDGQSRFFGTSPRSDAVQYGSVGQVYGDSEDDNNSGEDDDDDDDDDSEDVEDDDDDDEYDEGVEGLGITADGNREEEEDEYMECGADYGRGVTVDPAGAKRPQFRAGGATSSGRLPSEPGPAGVKTGGSGRSSAVPRPMSMRVEDPISGLPESVRAALGVAADRSRRGRDSMRTDEEEDEEVYDV